KSASSPANNGWAISENSDRKTISRPNPTPMAVHQSAISRPFSATNHGNSKGRTVAVSESAAISDVALHAGGAAPADFAPIARFAYERTDCCAANSRIFCVMAKLRLPIVIGDYDRTRPLRDGRGADVG